jgi:hypothetical protein
MEKDIVYNIRLALSWASTKEQDQQAMEFCLAHLETATELLNERIEQWNTTGNLPSTTER